MAGLINHYLQAFGALNGLSSVAQANLQLRSALAGRSAGSGEGPSSVGRAQANDQVQLSAAGLAALADDQLPPGSPSPSPQATPLSPTQATEAAATEQNQPRSSSANDRGEASTANAAGKEAATAAGQALDEQQLREVQQLQSRDREVRQHEQAHLAAAGGLARGGPSYSYQRGPDGKSYAIGGEVRIDTAPVPGDPEATIRKMEQVQRAALAPAQPSTADRAIASQASARAAEARLEMRASSADGGARVSAPREKSEDEAVAATDATTDATTDTSTDMASSVGGGMNGAQALRMNMLLQGLLGAA